MTAAAERIVILLPNWFGEALFATPALRALHDAAPAAQLSVMGPPRALEALAHHPIIGEALPFDERGAQRELEERQQTIRLLRRNRFDTAIILRRSFTRTWLVVKAGVPRRIGVDNWKSGWLLTARIPAPRSPMHKADAYIGLLAPWGVAARTGAYELHLDDGERAWARRWMAAHALEGRHPLVVLHPGANWEHKRWPPERFADAAGRLAASGAALLVTGGPDDAPLVRAIADRVPAAVNAAGKTTFRQLASLMARADLVIAADTGVLHAASALGRRVVALYGPTSPALTGPLGHPDLTTVLHHPECCPRIPCYQPHHPAYPGMASISVDEVVDAARRLLAP